MSNSIDGKSAILRKIQISGINSFLDSVIKQASLTNDRDLIKRVNEARECINRDDSIEEVNDMSQEDYIRDFLEKSYTGANMMDDFEMMVRLARAISAFDLPTDKDVLICTRDNIIDKLK